ncbi:hypothetical protein [uncultured Croceitalea sp.]|uniref:hypothetical protein n=1 Tax=uncultured Croceitalea sp. TaxID=1798908 RepID=UPI003305EE0A
MRYLFLLSFLFSLFIVKGQELKNIEELLKTVEAAKITFRQNIKQHDDGLVEYHVVEVDSKGKEVESFFRFNFSDIDINTVRSITKKDVIIVQLLIAGRQKLIQKIFDGGDKISYQSEINLLASNSENSNQLVAAIKKHIPNAIKNDEKRLSLISYQEHLDWLLQNIGDVELPKRQIIQQASSNAIVGKLTLNQTFNNKSKTKNELRELNLSTLNPNSVAYKISGDEFIISASLRRGINGMRYSEDGEQKNYQSDLKIYASSITNGKDLYKVLKGIIPLAEIKFEQNKPNVQDEVSALLYVNKVIPEISYAEATITQNITVQGAMAQLKQTESQPDKSTSFVYSFNFADVNANNIDYNGQKDRLYAVLHIKKSINFIQQVKNGALENYTDEVKVYFSTIEDAIIGVEALKTLATIYESKIAENTYDGTAINKAIEQLNRLMKKVTIEENTYDLFIELIDEKTSNLKVTSIFSNLKKSVETIQEFNLSDINPKNCSIQVKGKHIIAELNTRHLEKIVKTYVDGQIKPYQYKVQIEAKGIEEAREIILIFKTLAENSK